MSALDKGCWVGVWCGCEVWELEKWAGYLDVVGASSDVVAYLRDSARVVGGYDSSGESATRIREIECRAAESIERKRAEVSGVAGDIVSRVFAGGDVDVGQVLGAAGMDGWTAGREGTANGGIRRNLGKAAIRKNASKTRSSTSGSGGSIGVGRAAHGGKVRGTGGSKVTTSADTLRKDSEYAAKFEAWAGVQLCAMGFKMRHAARGVGLDVSTLWRYVSAYRRHVKRNGLAGRSEPAVSAEWQARLKECVDLATGTHLPGRHSLRNGVVKKAMKDGDV